MLSPLKFVQGAIAKKDYVPALTHFRIKDGRIMGFNGAIALSSPIDLDLDCSPKATPFIRAIQTCRETIRLILTEKRKLEVSSGAFKVFIDCLPQEAEFPWVEPEGEEIPIDGKVLISCLRTLEPFIGEDASRPFCRGVLFRRQSAYATNNIILIEKWLGVHFPEINIPEETVSELLRIGEPPTRVRATGRSISFLYENGQWLRSQLLTTEWPDVSRILDREGQVVPFPSGFFEALEDLTPFIAENECCHFQPGQMSTEATEGAGASIHLEGFGGVGAFNLLQLKLLKKVAHSIDFSCFPAPSLFFNEDQTLRGVIVGKMVLSGQQ